MEYNFIARVQETHACDDSMSAGATTVVEFDLMHGAQCVETRRLVRAPTSFCHRDVGARFMRKTAACLSMKEPNPDRARLAPDPTTAQVGKVDALRCELFRFKSAASSVQRASAVRNFLSAQGVEFNRMSAVGFGERFPIASNDTEYGKAQNRRVEITLSPASEY